MSFHKIAILSDIHANSHALRAVLAHAQKQGTDQIWFLGDAVGYGPAPNRCIHLLMENIYNPNAWVLGNHDLAMQFPPPLPGSRRKNIKPKIHAHLQKYIGEHEVTLAAFQFNYEIMEKFPQRLEHLLSHGETSQLEDKFFLVHGGLRNGSATTTYIWDRLDAQQEFFITIYMITRETQKKLRRENLPPHIIQKLDPIKNQEMIGEEMLLENLRRTLGFKETDQFKTTIMSNASIKQKRRFPATPLNTFFYGNTHHPACFKGVHREQTTVFHTIDLEPEIPLQLDDEHIWYLNPGSVGQPRDGDNRASYMTIDRSDQTLRLHRIEYNIRGVQKDMEELDFPHNLISRLSLGR